MVLSRVALAGPVFVLWVMRYRTQSTAKGALRHRMRRNRAGEEQEDANQRQFEADESQPLMHNQSQDDKTNPGRIHHPDSMRAAEQVRKPHKTKAANQQRNHTERNKQS